MSTTREATNDVARRGMWRSRWAAVGAAVAVSLGAGGLFVAQAAPGPSESTIVTVTPERILDTRDPNNVGLGGPFVSAVSQKLQVTGSIQTATGTKTVVPAGATGVLLNVTPVNATADGFISIRPGDATGAPTTSSLNFTRGNILPNAVQVAMPTAGADAGKIDITYDAYGQAGPTTDLLIDVVGYMTSAGLQELVADVNALKANAPIARSARVNDVIPDPNGTNKIIASVTITVPVNGMLLIDGSTYILSSPAGDTSTDCFLTSGAGVTSSTGALQDSDRSDFTSSNGKGACSTNIGLPVTAGTHVINLVSDAPTGVDLDDTTLDVLFVAGGSQVASLADDVVQEDAKG